MQCRIDAADRGDAVVEREEFQNFEHQCHRRWSHGDDDDEFDLVWDLSWREDQAGGSTPLQHPLKVEPRRRDE